MTKKAVQKFTLHQPVTYQIKVPGKLDEQKVCWFADVTISIENKDDGSIISTILGTLDQAGLLGLLRHLYSLGVPLISVIYVKSPEERGNYVRK